jgi:hypothetical protein
MSNSGTYEKALALFGEVIAMEPTFAEVCVETPLRSRRMLRASGCLLLYAQAQQQFVLIFLAALPVAKTLLWCWTWQLRVHADHSSHMITGLQQTRHCVVPHDALP